MTGTQRIKINAAVNRLDYWLEITYRLLCVFLRTLGVFLGSPVLGIRFIPPSAKSLFALVTAFLLWSLVPGVQVPVSWAGLAAGALGELAFGLAMGFMALILFSAVETAGHIADIELGFGLANVMDPQFGHMSPLLGTVQYGLVVLVFLAIDGHHMFIRALYRSFQVVPAGGAFLPEMWPSLGITAASSMFQVALGLSCPIWVSVLAVDVALGLIAHSVPQMNVFAVGMPAKVLIGLTVFGMSVMFYGVLAERISGTVWGLLQSLLETAAR